MGNCREIVIISERMGVFVESSIHKSEALGLQENMVQNLVGPCRACYKSTFKPVTVTPTRHQNGLVIAISRRVVSPEREGRSAHRFNVLGILYIRELANVNIIFTKGHPQPRPEVGPIITDQTGHFSARLKNVFKVSNSSNHKRRF